MTEPSIVRAYAKGVNQAPRKISLVASLVRGRSVADALVILAHTPKRAAKPLTDVIESAKANAINNEGMEAKTLVISKLSATAGVRLKRFIPDSRGRALPFQKKATNILVEISGELKPKKSSNETKVKTTVKKESK